MFCGRPALWGLANGGQDGVEKVLGILKMEFEYAMGLSGNNSYVVVLYLRNKLMVKSVVARYSK